MIHYAALLALGLCADPQDTTKPATSADIAKMEADVKAVLDRLNSLEKALKSYDDQHSKLVAILGENIQSQINDIHKKLNAIRTDVDDMKRARVSASDKRTEPTTPMAAVMLVNARPDMPMETIVNGASYWVEPSSNRVINVPAGALQVRVVSTDAVARERTVQAGATHVVTLR
jgi:septal ring factor EnvC (AmiA/AmiB activator)